MTEDRLEDGEPVVSEGMPDDSMQADARGNPTETQFDDGFIATPAQFTRVREEKGWSVAGVAGRLRMQVRQIEAIEAGRWDDLPGTAFMRAAIRSYARLLDRDAAPLLSSVAQLDTGLDLRSSTRAPVAISPTGSFGETSGIGRWGLALLGLLAVIAIAFYFAPAGDLRWPSQWFGDEGGTIDSASTIAVRPPATGTEPAAARREPLSAGSPSDDAVAAAARAANELLGSRPAAIAATTPGAGEESAAGTAPGSPADASTGTPVDAAAGTAGTIGTGSQDAGGAAVAGATESAPAEPAATPPPDSSTAMVAASSLMMSFDAECWVEVSDAGGRRVVYGLQKPQTSLSLDVAGPVSVLIGNADAVTMTRAGEAVDVKSAARDGVARLRLQ